MTATIGTATVAPDGTTSELRVFDSAGAVALTFLHSAVTRYSVEDDAARIPYAEGELSIAGAFPLPVLVRGANIELWLLRDKKPEHRMFRGVLEYIETSSQRGGCTTVMFQARDSAAGLMDAPFKGEVGPTLASVVVGLVERVGLRAATEYPETELSAWISAQSSYGVLRLLATNLDAIVRTRDERVEFVSSAAYLSRAQARPTVQLTADQILTARTVQGQPVKK